MNVYDVLLTVTNSDVTDAPETATANMTLTEISNIANHDVNLIQQITYKITPWVSTVTASCGVFGNILGAAVLHRMQKTNSSVRLLKYLSLVDIVLLVLVVLSVSNHLYNRAAMTIYFIFYPFAYLLAMVVYTFEIYLTVLIAIQRCIAIALPFKSESFMRASVINTALGCIAVFSVAFNVPLWLAWWPQPYWNTELNMQLFMKDPGAGLLGADGYKVYIGPVMLVFRCVIPLIILVTCNIILMISRRRMNSGNPQLSNRGSAQLTVLVMAITSMSVLTHVVSAVSLSLTNTVSKTTLYFLSDVTILLIVINCSTNFIFYYSFGKGFRQNFKSCFRQNN